jgi:hypothetical protein
MSRSQEVSYTFDLGLGTQGLGTKGGPKQPSVRAGPAVGDPIARLARLMALALRLEGLLRANTIRDYAELASLGKVTRARVTQLMQLLDLAPDLQEQILFLPPIKGLNERSLRPVVRQVDWDEQRRLFQKVREGCPSTVTSA